MKNLAAAGVVSLVVSLVAVYFSVSHQQTPVGAISGPDVYQNVQFHAGIVVNSSNTATSTTQVGCIQGTATSTATPIRFVIGTSGATTTYQGTKSKGVVGWQYGTCPA